MPEHNNAKLETRSIPFTKLLPNIITLVGLIIGVTSVKCALENKWELAVCCILIATIIDGLDGRIARMLNSTSDFGAELDSLCDFGNFGLCPAIITYLWLSQQYNHTMFIWVAMMFFIICMAVRLARFNVSNIEPETFCDNKSNIYSSEERHDTQQSFIGVPAPIGAILALVPIILDFKLTAFITEYSLNAYATYINLYVIFIGLLLAGRFHTISLKNTHIHPEYLSVFMSISTVIIIITILYPWYVIPLAALCYILYIPIYNIILHFTRNKQTQ